MRFNIFLSLSLVNVTRLHHLTCVPFSYSQSVSQWSKKLLRGFRWWRGGGEDEWWGRVVNCQSFLHSYLLFLNTRETKNSLLGTHLEGDFKQFLRITLPTYPHRFPVSEAQQCCEYLRHSYLVNVHCEILAFHAINFMLPISGFIARANLNRVQTWYSSNATQLLMIFHVAVDPTRYPGRCERPRPPTLSEMTLFLLLIIRWWNDNQWTECSNGRMKG